MAMRESQAREQLPRVQEDMYETKLGGKAGDSAWFQVLCEHVNALPFDEGEQWRDTHAEQIARVMWFTPAHIDRITAKRRRSTE